MNYFDQLRRSVLETIKAGRVGQPVFVRFLVASDANRETQTPLLARLVQTAGEWLGAPPRRLYATVSPLPAGASVSVRFENGATALVSTATPGHAGPTIDVIVLGNHGAVYHDGFAVAAESAATVVDGHEDPALRAAIEATMRSMKPHVLPGKEAP